MTGEDSLLSYMSSANSSTYFLDATSLDSNQLKMEL
ncbi:hypothetical protein LINGRAHAP2_LOCUS20155 [Linum grandiflorum]